MHKINFKEGEFELVENLPFKVKGTVDSKILFKKKEDYFVADCTQLDSPIKDFLSFCSIQVYDAFCKFKYGEDFFEQAEEFHANLEMLRFENEEESKPFNEDFKEFEVLNEEEFEDGRGEYGLFPAIVIQRGSERWKQYEQFTARKLPGNDNVLVSKLLERYGAAIFCMEDDGTTSLLHHFLPGLKYNILRGKGTIGNLIEINFGTVNLLLDCGKEVDADEESELEKQVLARTYDAILISHYHSDHAGLIDKAKSPIYMGRGCLDVLNSQNEYSHKQALKNINCFMPNEEISIKNGSFQIKIKPILVDHSAYDSYMFLISAGEESLLYTGDFRANGRKSFESMLKNLPNKVDFLICEATNLFSQNKNVSEVEIEQQATELMEKYKHVFVFQAGTNIDRLVSFYKASRKNNKVFLMDTYVAGITENLPNIPNVRTFADVFCFWDIPKEKHNFVKRHEADWRVFRRFGRGVGSCEIGSPKNGRGVDFSNFTMLVRPSMLNYLKRVDEDKKVRFGTSIFENSVLVYSLWRGYKEKEDVKNFLNEMQKLGVEIVDLHTSGHADKETVDRLIKKVNPGVVEYVHYIEKTL